MVRTVAHFVNNKKIFELLNLFELSQGLLFHYTKSDHASSIVGKQQLQITRADSFLDTNEVKYGTDILREKAKSLMSENETLLFEEILSVISTKMQQSYVFSTSQNGQSDYLKENYGTSILELPENFPLDLALGSSHGEVTEGVYRVLGNSNELYDWHEGRVVYDPKRQEEIATAICCTFVDEFKTGLSNVDVHHFIDIVSKFVLLLKEKSYSLEEEYRIVLSLRNNVTEKFEEGPVLIRGKERYYLKLSLGSKIINFRG